jgi:hypothetical protein
VLVQPRLFIRRQILLRLGAEIASTQNLYGAVGVLLLAALVIVLVLLILRRLILIPATAAVADDLYDDD